VTSFLLTNTRCRPPLEHLLPFNLLQHVVKACIGSLQKAVEASFPAHGDDIAAALEATLHNPVWWRDRGPAIVRSTGILFAKILAQISFHRYLEVSHEGSYMPARKSGQSTRLA